MRFSQAIVERVPAPAGQARGAAAGAGLQQPFRFLQGRRRLRPRHGGAALQGAKDPPDAQGDRARRHRAGPVSSRHDPVHASWSPGQVGYLMAQIKTLSDVHIGDTVTEAARPATEALPGYKEPKPMVFFGPVSRQQQRFREPARGARQAPPQRRQLHLPARKQRRPGFRLPLRLSRHAPSRDHPAASRAR